jgi:hypothetical protein
MVMDHLGLETRNRGTRASDSYGENASFQQTGVPIWKPDQGRARHEPNRVDRRICAEWFDGIQGDKRTSYKSLNI